MTDAQGCCGGHPSAGLTIAAAIAAHHGLTTYNYVMAIQAEEERATAYMEESDSDMSTEEEEELEKGAPSPELLSLPPEKIVTVDPDVDKSSELLPGQIDEETQDPPLRGPVRLAPISASPGVVMG